MLPMGNDSPHKTECDFPRIFLPSEDFLLGFRKLFFGYLVILNPQNEGSSTEFNDEEKVVVQAFTEICEHFFRKSTLN